MSAFLGYLQGRGVAFTVLPSPGSDSALDTVHAHGIPAAELVRTIVLQYRYGFALMVVPASRELNIYLARTALDDPDARDAHVREIVHYFPDCEPDAVPPLGLRFLAPMWVDPEVMRHDQVAFAAGKPSLVIRMAARDLFGEEPYVVTPLCAESAQAATDEQLIVSIGDVEIGEPA